MWYWLVSFGHFSSSFDNMPWYLLSFCSVFVDRGGSDEKEVPVWAYSPPLPSPLPLFPLSLPSLPGSAPPGAKAANTCLQYFESRNRIWWPQNCLYVLQLSQRSGGMVSSRPMKCRYAIPAHTVPLRALLVEDVHLISSQICEIVSW